MYRIFYIRANKLIEKRFNSIEELNEFCENLKKNPLITRIWTKNIYGEIKKIL